MRADLLTECADVQEDCTYSAETHHVIAAKRKRQGNLLQIGPAVVTAGLGVLTGTAVLPPWSIWLSVGAAVVTAVANVLNPFAEYHAHLSAAKAFTILKHDARALHAAFAATMSDDTFVASVKSLHDRYSDLVRTAPETDTKSFEEARRRIQQGRHQPDRVNPGRPSAT